MRKICWPILAIACLTVGAPGAWASPAGPGDAPGPAPEALDGVDCKNYGIHVMITVLGENKYCVDDECENYGIIVFAGETESCYGSTLLLVCVGGICPKIRDVTPANEASALDPRSGEQGVGKCAVVEDPVCWTVRFTCRWLQPVENIVEENVPGSEVHCPCQPGDPACEEEENGTRVDLLKPRSARAGCSSPTPHDAASTGTHRVGCVTCNGKRSEVIGC